jgi:hypothetical protein
MDLRQVWAACPGRRWLSEVPRMAIHALGSLGRLVCALQGDLGQVWMADPGRESRGWLV